MAQSVMDDTFMLVRPESGSADAYANPVRSAIGRIDREQLVSVRRLTTLEDIARTATARHRFRAVMVMTFAGLALLLAMVGVFGILAYSVQLRVRDFALRRAFGATTGDVLRLVVASAARMIAAGALIGLMLSALCGRRAVGRRPGLAGGPDRPGGGAAERVTAASGNGLCPEEPVCYALYRISWPLLWRCVGSRPQWAALPFVRAGDDASRHEA